MGTLARAWHKICQMLVGSGVGGNSGSPISTSSVSQQVGLMRGEIGGGDHALRTQYQLVEMTWCS